VLLCGGATSRAPIAVGGPEASRAVRSAIASPKRFFAVSEFLFSFRGPWEGVMSFVFLWMTSRLRIVWWCRLPVCHSRCSYSRLKWSGIRQPLL
jgi:hypothetical protein